MSTNSFTVGITGVRAGERVVANRHKATNNVIGSSMTFLDDFPVLDTWFDALTPADKDRVYNTLTGAPSFTHMTPADVGVWIENNTYDTKGKDLYINDFNIRVTDVVLGGEDIAKYLSEEDIARFASPNPNTEGWWTIKDIYNACIRNRSKTSGWVEGKDSGKAVLIFRPNLWVVATTSPQSYEGYYVDLTRCGEVHRGIINTQTLGEGSSKLYVMWGVPYAVITPSAPKRIRLSQLITLVKNRFPHEGDVIDTLVNEIRQFDAGYYKSLIQKIMRSSAHHVSAQNNTWCGDVGLSVAFILLINHPGSFHPELQTFVTGAESAFKRAAVTIVEDAWISDHRKVLRLLIRALLMKQHRGTWFYTEEDVNDSLDTLIEAWSNNDLFQYGGTGIKTPIVLPEEPHSELWCIYALLRECGSFDGDVRMFGEVVRADWSRTQVTPSEVIRETMPLIHAIDMHSVPDYVYCFDATPLYALGYKSFEQVVGSTWKYSSSYNPRRGMPFPSIDDENGFVTHLRVAQQRTYNLIRRRKGGRETREVITPTQRIDVAGVIHPAILCGVVGSLRVKAKNGKAYLVSINPYSLKGRVVMENPTAMKRRAQDKKNNDNAGDNDVIVIPDDVRVDAIRIFNTTLERGILLTKSQVAPYYWLAGGVLRYEIETSDYTVELNGEVRLWTDYLTPSATVDVVERLPDDINVIDGVLRYISTGVEVNYMSRLKNVFSQTDVADLVSLQCVLESSIEEIVMTSVGLRGEGTTYTSRLRDLVIVELLSHIAVIVPFALYRKSQRVFTITFHPFMRVVGQIVEREIATRSGEESLAITWEQIEDTTRTPRDYQLDVISRLATGDRVHIIDADAGSGKTLCIFEDVKRLIANGDMPSYLIYFTIQGGIETAQKEAKLYGLETNIIVPLRNPKRRNDKILPGVVNIIKYDHARMYDTEERLVALAADAYVVFDEFDTALNPCLKTSTALVVAQRARRVIALSATPIKDRHIEYLIPWLQQVVPFNVVYSNIWTALGAMISKRVDYGIKITRLRHEAQFEITESAHYESLMHHPPGGRISPTAFHAGVEMCFTVSLREQVNQTLEWLNRMPVFLVVRKRADQLTAKRLLLERGVNESEIAFIGDENVTTTYIEGDGSPVRVLIATVYNTRSYTATKMGVLITGVYFVSEATRIQTIGRIKRLTQRRRELYEITVHAGLLSKVLERYDYERSMIAAARSASEFVGGDLLAAWGSV